MMLKRARFRAFTILEFVVAAVIIAAVFAATGVAMANATKSLSVTHTRDAATALGYSVLEKSRLYGCDSLSGTIDSPAQLGFNAAEAAVVKNCNRAPYATGGVGNLAGTATQMTEDGNGICAAGSRASDNAGDRCFKVTVRSNWRFAGQSVPGPGANLSSDEIFPFPASGCAVPANQAFPRLLVRGVLIEHPSLPLRQVVDIDGNPVSPAQYVNGIYLETVETMPASLDRFSGAGKSTFFLKVPSSSVGSNRIVINPFNGATVTRYAPTSTTASASCAWFPYVSPPPVTYPYQVQGTGISLTVTSSDLVVNKTRQVM